MRLDTPRRVEAPGLCHPLVSPGALHLGRRVVVVDEREPFDGVHVDLGPDAALVVLWHPAGRGVQSARL